MDFGIATVLAITILSYLVGEVTKLTPLNSKWVPVVCGIFGLLFGIGAFYTGMPDFPASDPITAAAVGVASGLAATGANQIFKQLSSKDE